MNSEMKMVVATKGPKGIELGAVYGLLVGSKVVAAKVLGFPSSGGVEMEANGKTINVSLASVERRFKGKIKSA